MRDEDWRQDRRRVELMDNVLRADVNQRAVARFLADVGVPLEVVRRVIMEPGRRRRHDGPTEWPAPASPAR